MVVDSYDETVMNTLRVSLSNHWENRQACYALRVDIVMIKCPDLSDNENERFILIGSDYMETNVSLACQTPWASDPDYELQGE